MERIVTFLGILVAVLAVIFALVGIAGDYLFTMVGIAIILVGVGVVTGR